MQKAFHKDNPVTPVPLILGLALIITAVSFIPMTRMESDTDLAFTEITGELYYQSGYGSHAIAFCDLNEDGYPGFYITKLWQLAMSDLYYRNEEGRYIMDAVVRQISDMDGGSHGACWADLDNDGDYDLVNGTTYSTGRDSSDNNNIYINDGSGLFSEITGSIPEMLNTAYATRAALALDREGDGDLDLVFISGYLGSGDDPEELNEHYVNDGGLIFHAEDGGDLASAPAAQGAVDTDIDGDGDVDILAANRTGKLNILLNDGSGTFTLADADALLDTAALAGDGITAGDVNGDGRMDLILVSEGPPSRASLYLQQASGLFHRSQSWDDVKGYMGGLADLDLDGDLDLIFAGDTLCWLNNGSGSFTGGPEIVLEDMVDPRCIAFADLDSDGDMDFIITDKWSHMRIIRNDLAANNWLKVSLITGNGQAGGFGAKVFVYPAGELFGPLLAFREARSNEGYLAQNDPVLHFGTGQDTIVDVAVHFVDGQIAVATDVPVNQTLLVEGNPGPVLMARAFLEGAWNEQDGEMSTVLNDRGLLPLSSPYKQDTLTVTAIDSVVTDWILLELRNMMGGQPPWFRSLWLRKDGWLMDPHSGQLVISLALPPGDYTALMHHRNHLSILKDSITLAETGSVVLSFGGVGTGKLLASGVYGMIAGNADSTDQAIFASDLAAIHSHLPMLTVPYINSDINLDGNIDLFDYNLCKTNMLAGLYSKVKE